MSIGPYTPAPFAQPIVNPAVGSIGAPALPYLSNSQYLFAPTAVDAAHLVPGGSPPQQAQALADTLRRASAWADNICFGTDPATKGASLAASLAVQSGQVRIRQGLLRLVCDYKPVLEVVGIDIGFDPSNTTSVGAATAAMARIGRRSITVPLAGSAVSRSGDSPLLPPTAGMASSVYAVWSYVSGYPHTELVASIAAGATTATVAATDGAGGLWGVYPASGAFPGTQLTVADGASTESVYVQAIAPGAATCVLTTSPFASAHTLAAPPDFLAVSAVPPDVTQAAISLTTMLIKTRGARALVMPSLGGVPQASRQAFAQAGALEDWDIAAKLLAPYRVHSKGVL